MLFLALPIGCAAPQSPEPEDRPSVYAPPVAPTPTTTSEKPKKAKAGKKPAYSRPKPAKTHRAAKHRTVERAPARPRIVPRPSRSSSRRTAPTGSARGYARSRLSSAQYGCLDSLVTHESGWNPYATNPSSGAYGLFQALPGSKMASAGADWRTNPITQVRWGLSYIGSRYGSPCGAWSFWQGHHWY
ncbi:transglycosylase SLT domain-containing protein [Streptomyces sp. NPDC004528]|uniref:aggregation-promoting factor C-terminal-like domain-containing protein n=1 Tax=Streptomyces sp. NPDC004528 TaxID=3154550 RepID=UPI0033A6D2EE